MYLSLFHQKQPIHLHDVKYAIKLESEQLPQGRCQLQGVHPIRVAQDKGTIQSDDAQVEQVQAAISNTAQVGDIQPANNTAQAGAGSACQQHCPGRRHLAHQQHCLGGRSSAHQQHCPGGRGSAPPTTLPRQERFSLPTTLPRQES